MSDDAAVGAIPATPPKLDPETFVLRARPARAIRFRRGAIVFLAATAAVGVAATAWMALEPRATHSASAGDDKNVAARSATDALSGLPSSYEAVPRLGPPLPGDLGKPILDRQRQLAAEAGEPVPPAPPPAGGDAGERRAAELKTARESGLMVQIGTRPEAGQGPAPAAATDSKAVGGPSAESVAAEPEGDPNGQRRKADFVRTVDDARDINPHEVVRTPSPFILSAGSVISASLITGLRSDLPGLVSAQVSEQIFDSPTGRILLIPQGARLIGAYDSVVAFGQRRALVVWQRIIFPDGSSVRLENAPATDASGYAGLADKVDFHTWSLLRGVVLSTLLGVGSELRFTGESDLVQAVRQSTQQNISRAGDQLTSRNLQVQPTITVRPGAPVRLLVHHDLVLKPWVETR
jgi:type IV secretion system protein TrbI